MTPSHLPLLTLLFGAACATATPAGVAEPVPNAGEPRIECKIIDTSTPAKISVIEGDGVSVHTFLAPAVSSGTATHVIETADSLVIVDTQMLRAYAAEFRAYADGLGKPISHVFVSHGHPDHYFGLESFDDRPTYALPETAKQIRARGAFHLLNHQKNERECDAVTDRVRVPEHTAVVGELVVGGTTLILERVRKAEDNDQLVIRVPAAKTLILQDLMATDTHGFISAGFEEHWVEVLEAYGAAEAYEHVLAGHGAPTDRAGIATMIDYVERGAAIAESAESAEAFIEAMRVAFPDKQGMYLVELMGKLNFR